MQSNFDVVAANAFIGSQFLTQGNTFFVRPKTGSDGSDGKSPKRALKTLTEALKLCTAGQNDVVYLMAESDTAGNTTDYQSVGLVWNKDLCHIIGVNAGGMISQRSRVGALSTAPAIAALFTLSANGCLIQNIEFFHGAGSTTLSAAQTCVLVSGERNRFVNCMIAGMGDTTMDYAGSNSLTVTGEENLFQHCYIGLDTMIRATSITEVVISGAPSRIIFEYCHFSTWTSGSTFKMITVASGVLSFVKFTDCDFVALQNQGGAVAPTGLIGITTMGGVVIVRNPYLYGFAQFVTADNAYVQVLGFNGLATGHLVGISQGVDAA
jgi:hypothetical protein